MKYRVVDTNEYFMPTYFKTKREAVAYAETITNYPAAVEKKLVTSWVRC